MTETLGNREYETIRQIVYDRSRIDLGSNKRELVAARVNKRLRKLGFNTYAEYCRYIGSPLGEEELGELIDVISTNHTFFFRESGHFDYLTRVLLPEVRGNGFLQPGEQFRVWSAASSTGEEAYSVAMTLDQELSGAVNRREWQIDATDISTKVLAHARDGVYPAERVKGVPAELVRRYFQRGVGNSEGYFRVKETLRSRVRFHHLNLLKPPYPFQQRFHLILCRNVMIYFDRPTQQELVNHLSEVLAPGGVLMIGHSESLNSIKHSMKLVQPAVFRLDAKTVRC